jgi:hypothetical protein
VAHELARQAVANSGAGLVEVLRLLLKRAEQIRTGEELAGDAGPGLLSEGLAQEPLLADVYRPLCLKLFLACAFTALAEQLKSQLKHRDLLAQVRQIAFSQDGDVDGFNLNDAA